MSKDDARKDQLDKVSTGDQIGGTHFGQNAGDAKTGGADRDDDKPRPDQNKK